MRFLCLNAISIFHVLSFYFTECPHNLALRLNLHCTDEETEVHGGCVNFPRPHNSQVVQQRPKLNTHILKHFHSCRPVAFSPGDFTAFSHSPSHWAVSEDIFGCHNGCGRSSATSIQWVEASVAAKSPLQNDLAPNINGAEVETLRYRPSPARRKTPAVWIHLSREPHADKNLPLQSQLQGLLSGEYIWGFQGF